MVIGNMLETLGLSLKTVPARHKAKKLLNALEIGPLYGLNDVTVCFCVLAHRLVKNNAYGLIENLQHWATGKNARFRQFAPS